MVKCSFCGQDLVRGTGKMFVKKEGAVFFFCSNKCEKNMLKLKRPPQSKKWTLAWHAQSQSRHAKAKGEKK